VDVKCNIYETLIFIYTFEIISMNVLGICLESNCILHLTVYIIGYIVFNTILVGA
jgi:hypothetical protein